MKLNSFFFFFFSLSSNARSAWRSETAKKKKKKKIAQATHQRTGSLANTWYWMNYIKFKERR